MLTTFVLLIYPMVMPFHAYQRVTFPYFLSVRLDALQSMVRQLYGDASRGKQSRRGLVLGLTYFFVLQRIGRGTSRGHVVVGVCDAYGKVGVQRRVVARLSGLLSNVVRRNSFFAGIPSFS